MQMRFPATQQSSRISKTRTYARLDAGSGMTGIEQALKRNNIVLGAVGEAGYIFNAIFTDHENIMFAITPGTRQALR
jgi:hypothetical protein